ncbi:Anthocyanin 3'-O-beta-glucosyltransferase [Hibiscus syriacus]|uniref:Anthocyanin 3'-O-beta-glucosyltransferase n=1 Tax=Hibiscus syriacus TaxID=106335 RepID=A0A6A3BA21_HIBSY|nr:uncharacterized protein At4g06744-like [Hibiscus syriacus]KAE8711739.1 Anthocyanin 3'-O-beta-glucosyltransferase [Hibiscus syriacus]
MRTLSLSTSSLLFTILLHSCLDIITGAGEAPAPAVKPSRCKYYENENGCFENKRLADAYDVIQTLKKRIKVDKNSERHIKTWTGTDVCSYNGFKCDIRPDVKENAVSAVDFNGYRFFGSDGTLPLKGFIDEMDDLAIFHANSNHFTGTVPFEASKIKYLYELDLSNNKIEGDFPMETLNAMNLTFLDLRYNSLRGSVPPQVFNLTLDVLFINNNRFAKQTLPKNLGDTTALYLTFANNSFTGTIPRSIGKARNLLEVLFLDNRLSGCLPYEIGNLSRATVFDASRNKITGPIPYSFGCMKMIQILNLANNRFYGEVPEIVCELPIIANLSLANNYFTSIGPACYHLMTKKKIDVSKNCIFGLPNQRSEAECSAFLWKKKVCNRIKTFYFIPCEKYGYSKNSGDGNPPPAPGPPAKTYNTLIPHHRL